MYKVVRRKALRPTVTQLEIEAPLVARKADVDFALSTSLGFGGHNACIAFAPVED